ncbi:MAG: Asp-tRNA(Asn)/Glu-tRNA(Gln) amidotransferase subunit GatB [Deferribacterota bacterium]|nr:Asp-tRNA(Asn)/Glu-tRNA(Gln) amidotransferase subunit GatB [Deferribacterota bacterium]
MEFEVIIGLEVHVHLATRSKLFCSCKAEFGKSANLQTCPICLGMPGVLPVLNKRAIEYAIMAGLALNCHISEHSVFARKNYFYPDLPKGYQISQYELPLCKKGFLYIHLEDGSEKKIGITRVHVEEDAGKLIHGENLGDSSASYVDFNRAGIPLIEIVSEPDMRSPLEARLYMQKLRSILRYIGVSECNMEEGSLRCDANISLRKYGEKKFGVKSEIKNMNSFKNVQKALEYEVKRQTSLLEENKEVLQETRLWNPALGKTITMRTKEEENDYRYFPEPDLVSLNIDSEQVNSLREKIGELPDEKFKKLTEEYNLPQYDAEVLTSEKEYAEFFEATVSYYNKPKEISNLMMSELLRFVNEKNCRLSELNIDSSKFAKIIKLIDKGVISGKIAKDIFRQVVETGKDPEDIVRESGMKQISDEDTVVKFVDEVLEESPKEVERFKNGESKLLSFFIGQIMKKTRGKANPKLVNKILQKKLSE